MHVDDFRTNSCKGSRLIKYTKSEIRALSLERVETNDAHIAPPPVASIAQVAPPPQPPVPPFGLAYDIRRSIYNGDCCNVSDVCVREFWLQRSWNFLHGTACMQAD
jgi:hypothetical protein